jgi:hypothetical protein
MAVAHLPDDHDVLVGALSPLLHVEARRLTEGVRVGLLRKTTFASSLAPR